MRDKKLESLNAKLDAVLAERKMLDPDGLLTARFRGREYGGFTEPAWNDLVRGIDTELDFNAPKVAILTLEVDDLQTQIVDTALQQAADRGRTEPVEQAQAA